MAAGDSRSSSAADSYIGSVISLTSKSEMRYEGVLFYFNFEESIIGLANVRPFGTEGRKQDGPQVPPSEKIYEYILFRGSEIKDLNVISSPKPQSTPVIDDPAIIQSRYAQLHTIPTTFPTSGASISVNNSYQNAQSGSPGLNLQSGVPLYQPGGDLTFWGPPSPLFPSVNGGGLATPSYMQGYYGSYGGMPPPMSQQTLLQSRPNLPMPHNLQQSVQYPGFSSPLFAAGSSILSNSPGFTSIVALPPLPSHLTPAQLSLLKTAAGPEVVTDSTAIGSSVSGLLGTSFSFFQFPPTVIRQQDVNGNRPTFSLDPTTVSGPTSGATQLASAVSGDLITPMPNLVTPGQFAQPVPYNAIQSSLNISTQPPQEACEDREASQVSYSLPLDAEALFESPPPQLPSPVLTRAAPKSPRQVMDFKEEFDFTAMNEKFNKDETCGDLGMISREAEGDDNQYYKEYPHLLDAYRKPSVPEVKPFYNKDDFFDNLSSKKGTLNFSELRKLDTETFGEHPMHEQGGRGGRGYNNRGGSGGRGYDNRGSGGHGYNNRGGSVGQGYDNRGSGGHGYNNRGGSGGRGYNNRGGYEGRGRGRNMPN